MHSPAFKENVKKYYLQGDYNDLGEIARKFDMPESTLRMWISEEDWLTERAKLWETVRNNTKPLHREILERQKQDKAMWNGLRGQIAQVMLNSRSKNRPLKPIELNQLANAAKLVQNGMIQATTIKEDDEKEIQLQYKGLQEILNQQNADDQS